MDCVDCHNRPSHIFQPPDREIDRAISEGLIDRSLPFIKRESLRIIESEYASGEEAREAISDELGRYYAENYPDVSAQQSDDVNSAARALGDIYSVNVFPQMNVGWNTYPNHIGHQTSPGCFRCHSRRMRTTERVEIRSGCDVCHTVLSNREEDPQVLTDLLRK
jgi:hypothetical protein